MKHLWWGIRIVATLNFHQNGTEWIRVCIKIQPHINKWPLEMECRREIKDADNMLCSYDIRICWSKMNWYTHNKLMSHKIQQNAALRLWNLSIPHNLWYSISFYGTRQKLHRIPRNSVEILQVTAEAPQNSMELKAFHGVYPPALHATKVEFNWISPQR